MTSNTQTEPRAGSGSHPSRRFEREAGAAGITRVETAFATSAD
jgi:hypothetical protein